MGQIFDDQMRYYWKLPHSDETADELSGLGLEDALYQAWAHPYGTDFVGAARQRMVVRDVLPHLADILDALYVKKEEERYEAR